MAKRSTLADRLSEVRERIERSCARARRDASEVTLVAVTKAAPPEQIRELVQMGVPDLGENHVQQLVQRSAQINEFLVRRARAEESAPLAKLRWHMIGRLQRNKVKPLLPVVGLIHSVDSLRLAEELDEQAGKLGKRQAILLQINASEEAQKAGVAVGAAVHLAEQIDTMPHLQLCGVMAMAALDADEKTARHTFARTREIFEEMRWHKIGGADLRHLSMGMSGDFDHAVLEGATMIRVGTALFGAARDAVEEQTVET